MMPELESMSSQLKPTISERWKCSEGQDLIPKAQDTTAKNRAVIVKAQGFRFQAQVLKAKTQGRSVEAQQIKTINAHRR